MPRYDYRCRICGNEFEKIQPSTKRDFATCPKCSCLADEKLAPVNFTFGFVLDPRCHYVRGFPDRFVRNV